MNEYKNVEFASKEELCFQCGACTVACPQRIITMERYKEKGLIFPKIDTDKCIHCKKCLQVCPMCELEEPKNQFKSIRINAMRSKDKNIFNNSASGGVVTTILVSLFKDHQINKAILVDTIGMYAYPKICTTIEEVKNSSGSKYQPVALDEILNQLEPNDQVAVVGLPCHIKGIKNLINLYPKYKSIIRYTIGIICTIGRGLHATTLITEDYVNKNKNTSGKIQYRYGEYPGYVSFVNNSESKNLINYQDFLSKGDYFYYPTGCMFCNDLYNVEADVSIGDTWGLGYGKSALTIIRTEIGKQVINDCISSNTLEIIDSLSEEEALKAQKASYNFKIRNYNKRCNVLKKYTKNVPISYDKISTEVKAGWILAFAIKLLYLNSRVFNSSIGLKMGKYIPHIFLKVYRKILLLCLESERLE